MNKEELLQNLKKQGFSDKIINAFAKVPREDFIKGDLQKFAYEDIALPINNGETISQPSTIAFMLSLLKVHEHQKVMEIGSGCGYVLALISKIIGEDGKVFGMEISHKLAEKSKQTLKNYKNIFIFNKNGKGGLSEQAPFDRILISAALEKIPDVVLNQLKENGIIVAPIGDASMQVLTSIQRHENNFFILKRIPGFLFVPFVD
jgi:protein-L-isoaspartate(D-aspartate) O-methyltransferase